MRARLLNFRATGILKEKLLPREAIFLKYAIIDLGSNTIRLSVYRILPEGNYELLFSKKETAGIANYIRSNELSGSGIRRACSALTNFRELLRQLRIGDVHVFATASLRNIQNTEEAVKAIRETTGLDVEVLSGRTEAELGYYGALQTLRLKTGALFDIGGGSTEIVEVKDGTILRAQSLPVGSLNLFKRCVSGIWPAPKELRALQEQVERTLSSANLPAKKTICVCGIGGTARAMLKIANACLERPAANRRMTPDELHRVARLLHRQDDRARQLILNACPDRLHTILPGSLLMDELCGRLCEREIFVSGSGVREGYLYQRALQKGTHKEKAEHEKED